MSLVALRSLNLGENRITHIKNLSNCLMLEKLHLYCNQIEQIAGLQSCIALKELNVSENQISKVENLSRQVHLQSLYIAANPIEQFS